jgi:hypothetical protein
VLTDVQQIFFPSVKLISVIPVLLLFDDVPGPFMHLKYLVSTFYPFYQIASGGESQATQYGNDIFVENWYKLMYVQNEL